MKKSNELKYDIIAYYCSDEDMTMHFLICKANKGKYLIPNVIIDYGVEFHKVLPKYKIPSYSDMVYEPKSNTITMVLISKGNPFKIKENNQNVRIILYDVQEANVYKKDLPIYHQFPAPYTSYPTF